MVQIVQLASAQAMEQSTPVFSLLTLKNSIKLTEPQLQHL